MKNKHQSFVQIPEGIECSFFNGMFKCIRNEMEIERKIQIPGTEIKIEEGRITFNCEKANKKDIAIIKSNVAHIKNMFKGLNEKFFYNLEICSVHFPMTVKIDKNQVVISNFLGEKKSRIAEIVQGVNVEVKGNEIIVSSDNIEKAGQTAANIEKATKVSKRDRRVFQDGCFITKKPKGEI